MTSGVIRLLTRTLGICNSVAHRCFPRLRTRATPTAMNKKFSIVAALSLSLFVASACSKDKKEDSDKGDSPSAKVSDTKGGDTPTEVKPEAAKPGTTAVAGDIWGHMPADTEMVLALDVGSLTQSNLWKQYGGMATAAASEKLELIKEKCGIDLLTTFKSVHVGFNSDKEVPVIIVKGVERSVAGKCIVAMAESEGKKVTVTQEGPITIVKPEEEGKDGMLIGWVDDATAIIVKGDTDKDSVLARIAGKDGLDSNAGLMAMVGKAKQGAPIWFAAKFKAGSKAATQIKGMAEGKEISGVFGGVGFEKGIEIALGAEFANEADVTASKAKLDQIIPMGKMMAGPAAPLLDKVKIAASGKDLTINIDLSEADLTILTQMAGPMLGGMMGR